MLGGVLVALVAVGLFYVLRRPRPHAIGAFRQNKSAAGGTVFAGDAGAPMPFDASGNGRDSPDSDGWTDHGDGAADAADGGDGGGGDAGGGDGGGGDGGGGGE